MFFLLLFFSIKFSYVSQVFFWQGAIQRKEGKRQSTNYRQSYFFLLLHHLFYCYQTLGKKLPSLLSLGDKKLGNRREYLVSFHSNPEKQKKKRKCRHINSDDDAMLEEENDCCTTTPFSVCVEKKKDKRQHWNCV